MTGQKLFEVMGELDPRFVAEAADWTPTRVVRFHKRKIALLVAALLLLTACAAYVAVEWDTLFAEKFHPSPAALEQTKDSLQQVSAVSVCDGYTLTVRQTLGDDRTLHIALDIAFPEDVPLSELMITDGAGRQEPSISLDNLKFYHGKTEYDEIKGMDQQELFDYFRKRSISSGSSVGVSQQTVDLAHNTLSFLISYTADSSIMGVSDDPYFTMVIGSLEQYDGKNPSKLIAAGPFVISWSRTNAGTVWQMEVTEDGKLLGKVVLSGFSLNVQWFKLPGVDAAQELADSVKIRMKDGSDFAGTSSSGGSISGGDSSASLSYTWDFGEILILEEVESVLVGDYIVKVP